MTTRRMTRFLQPEWFWLLTLLPLAMLPWAARSIPPPEQQTSVWFEK